MGAEEGGDEPDGARLTDAAGNPKQLHLIGEVETVAGLGFERGDAFGDKPIQSRERLGAQGVVIGRAHGLNRGEDAAAGPRDVLIARTGQTHFPLGGAIAGIHDVGVTIDQPGRHPLAVKLNGVEG